MFNLFKKREVQPSEKPQPPPKEVVEETSDFIPVKHIEDDSELPMFDDWRVKISVMVEIRPRQFKIMIMRLPKKSEIVISTSSGKLAYRDKLNPATFNLPPEVSLTISEVYYKPRDETIILRVNATTKEIEDNTGDELVEAGNNLIRLLEQNGFNTSEYDKSPRYF